MSVSERAISAAAGQVRLRVEGACRRAGRNPRAVTLIAATKTQPPEAIAAAWRAGIRDFGENRVREALAKQPCVAALIESPGLRWHLIGRLQSNKAKVAARSFAILHAIDSSRTILALARSLQGPALPIMIEVNVAADPAKHGVAPAELGALVECVRASPALELAGLMTVPPRVERPEAARPYFARLRALAHEHTIEGLSMGMSEDFEVAIEEGATHVRVGRAIFGERAP